MNVHCVSYDLKKTGQDYAGLIDELKKSHDSWHYLKSTWLIATNETANQLFNRIKPYIDQNDYVLVIKVTTDYSGWLPKEAWDWIEKYLG